MAIEHRTIELKVTKRKLEAQEIQEQQETVNPGSCGPWHIEVRGGHYYTCRTCYTSGETGFPYEECIQLPD